jgi:hypothetical protein
MWKPVTCVPLGVAAQTFNPRARGPQRQCAVCEKPRNHDCFPFVPSRNPFGVCNWCSSAYGQPPRERVPINEAGLSQFRALHHTAEVAETQRLNEEEDLNKEKTTQRQSRKVDYATDKEHLQLAHTGPKAHGTSRRESDKDWTPGQHWGCCFTGHPGDWKEFHNGGLAPTHADASLASSIYCECCAAQRIVYYPGWDVQSELAAYVFKVNGTAIKGVKHCVICLAAHEADYARGGGKY